MSFYYLFKLNPNLKAKIHFHLTLFWNFSLCFLSFQRFLLYFTRIYNCVTGPYGLKLPFLVEMNIRNSKVAVRMLYENSPMQLHNKNMKINV